MRASDRREQILDITHAIVDAEGFHAATINRIATEAGVTRTVIYQQFGDLSRLFVALRLPGNKVFQLTATVERDNAIARFPSVSAMTPALPFDQEPSILPAPNSLQLSVA